MTEGAAASLAAPPRSGLAVARRSVTVVGALAVVATLLVFLLVGRLGATYRDGLQATSDGAELAALSTATANTLADEVAALAGTASQTLAQTRLLLASAATSTDDLGTAMDTNLADTVEGVANIANGLAGLVEAIEFVIPGDSDSLAEDLRDITNGLKPVPAQLRTLGEQLHTVADQISGSLADLDAAGEQLERLASDITEAKTALAQAAVVAADVAEKADDALQRWGTDLWLLRLVIVVLGAGAVLVCFVAHRALRALQA
ncbi:MAG: hypothetical protein Q7V57_19390 [Actinomycetota bacterium]|nr:hypothetical protein [Actinomycetota bacterium]